MNMIDLYVKEVGKYLAPGKRKDITNEIKSTLEDMLEERVSSSQDRNETVLSLLKEFGSPARVAAFYKTEQYLVGPGLFPTFLLVLKVIGIILVITGLVGFSFRLGWAGLTPSNLFSQLGTSISELLTAAFSALGITVLIFGGIERTAPRIIRFPGIEDKDWNPEELNKIPDPNQVNTASEIEGIVFNVFGLIIFNLFPHLISIRFLQDSSWVVIPLLSEQFFNILPWINATWILGMFVNLIMIHQNRRTLFTYIMESFIKAAGVVIAIFIITGPSVINLSTGSFIAFSIPAATAEILVKLINAFVVIGFINFILVSLYEIGRNLYKLVIKKVLL